MKKNIHKQITVLSVLTISTFLLGNAFAESGHEGHDHATGDHKEEKIKAPNGGRIIELDPYHMEFYATPERMIEVRIFDQAMKPVQLDQAEIQVVAQAESGSEKYSLSLDKGAFVSDQPLPEGDGYNLVVRVKTDADSSFKNIRFKFDPSICSGCKLGEYACICEGHDH